MGYWGSSYSKLVTLYRDETCLLESLTLSCRYGDVQNDESDGWTQYGISTGAEDTTQLQRQADAALERMTRCTPKEGW